MAPFATLSWKAACFAALLASAGVNGFTQKYCSYENTGSGYPAVYNIYQSNLACSDQCKDGYAFAVVQWQNCWCSNYAPAAQLPIEACNINCPGYPDDHCGNQYANLYGYIALGKGPSGTAGAAPTSITRSAAAASSSAQSVSSTLLITSSNGAAASSTASPSAASSSSSSLPSTPLYAASSATSSAASFAVGTPVVLTSSASSKVHSPTQFFLSSIAQLFPSSGRAGGPVSTSLQSTTPGLNKNYVLILLTGFVIIHKHDDDDDDADANSITENNDIINQDVIVTVTFNHCTVIDNTAIDNAVVDNAVVNNAKLHHAHSYHARGCKHGGSVRVTTISGAIVTQTVTETPATPGTANLSVQRKTPSGGAIAGA
ncbi:Cell wall integrity and stress response component 4, partial [Elasticomyces elasticus]